MPIYECVRCGRKATKEEWERGEPKMEEWERRERQKRGIPIHGGNFKCPSCGYRIAKKIRGPIARRVRAI